MMWYTFVVQCVLHSGVVKCVQCVCAHVCVYVCVFHDAHDVVWHNSVWWLIRMDCAC